VHGASVCFYCFTYLGGMLQEFCMYVVKVDQDVRYVATVVHVYCKCMFLMFYLFFQMYVTSVFI
jgi:hypothetical protein